MAEQIPHDQYSDIPLPAIKERQRLLAANFIKGIQPYLSGTVHQGMQLRTVQIPAMHEIREYFNETLNTPDRRLLWPGPPNAGKSTMAALSLQVTGIGQPASQNQEPLRSLICVSRDAARSQFIDSCNEKAPMAEPSPFSPKDTKYARDHGHSLVTTYKTITDLTEDEWDYIARKTDLFILDEVHRGIGRLSAERLRTAMQKYKPTTIAISATPDFDDERATAKILGIQKVLSPMTAREAIYAGVSNGVQLLSLHSGQSANFISKRGQITEHDLEPLAKNEVRNKLIVDTMENMALLGRLGLVRCIAGGNNQHAKDIAAAANERKIIDPKTNKLRHLRVEALGNHRADNAKVIQWLRDGHLDAVTFSKYLIESFDLATIRYIISAAPSASQVDIEQLVGRGARLGDEAVTLLITILDHYTSSAVKKLQTPFHVFNKSGFKQGEVITRGSSPSKPKPTAGNSNSQNQTFGQVRLEDLSEALQTKLSEIPIGTILDQDLIIKQDYNQAPDDYMVLAELPIVRDKQITPEGALYALQGMVDSKGRSFVISTGKGKRLFVSPEAVAYLNERYGEGTEDKVSRLEINNFLVSHGWPALSFDGFASECEGVQGQESIPYETIKGTIYLTRENTYKLLQRLAATPLIDRRQEVGISAISHAIGRRTSSDLLNAARKDTMIAKYMRERRKSLPGRTYSRIAAISIHGAIKLVEEISTRPAFRNALQKHFNDASPKEIIETIQKEYQQYFWQNKLVPYLSQRAIQEFISTQAHGLQKSQESQPSQSTTQKIRKSKTSQPSGLTEEQIKAAREKRQQGLGPKLSRPFLKNSPPQPLDTSYFLSDKYNDWSKFAACKDSDPEIFSSNRSKDREIALRTCTTCSVKGDCLLFHMQVEGADENIIGTRGGMISTKRKQLGPEHIDWLKSTVPKPIK